MITIKKDEMNTPYINVVKYYELDLSKVETLDDIKQIIECFNISIGNDNKNFDKLKKFVNLRGD